VDKFMSECRALTNVVGNGVATLVVSRWEGELTGADLRESLAIPAVVSTTEPEQVRAAGS